MEAKGILFSLKNRMWRAFAVAVYVTRNGPFWRTDSLPGGRRVGGAQKRPADETFGELRRPDELPEGGF
jgi:hypothetical protein